MLAGRESRPRSHRRSRRHRPPVNYQQSDDDDYDPYDDDYDPHNDYDPYDDAEYERVDLTAKRLRNMTKCARYRAEHPEKVITSKKKYRETHGDFIAVAKKCYREKHRARVAKNKKRYR